MALKNSPALHRSGKRWSKMHFNTLTTSPPKVAAMPLQSELASAYFKVGEVQGAPAKNNLGDYAGALVSFKKALGIREALYAKDSHNDKLKLDLTRSYQMVGSLSQATDDLPAALANYGRAFTIFGSLSIETTETKRELSTLHTRYANALAASGDHPKAIESYRKAIGILSELSCSKPGR